MPSIAYLLSSGLNSDIGPNQAQDATVQDAAVQDTTVQDTTVHGISPSVQEFHLLSPHGGFVDFTTGKELHLPRRL